MRRPLELLLLAAVLLPHASAGAVELTGRVSLLGAAARPAAGDIGDGNPGIDTPTADQQSLRLMLEGSGNDAEWAVHLKATRSHLRGFPAQARHSSELFRYRALADDRRSGDGIRRSTRLGLELDRGFYRHRFGKLAVSVGRQPVDWGSGRLWQPLNVFGAFAPTDLDTDFKPGIDAAVLDWYPSAFSSLTGVYALAPDGDSTIEDSAAIHYRRRIGENSQAALVAGRVVGNTVLGASFESDWRGVGWRIEGLHSKPRQSDDDALFWIAGVDYQFQNGTLVAVEWYDHGRGARREAALAGMQSERLVTYGLQPYLGRRVLGLSAHRDLTPLLRAGYTLLAAALRDSGDRRASSLLHQLNFVYSVGNESDLLLSLSRASGKGLDPGGQPQSEFGHLPPSVTLRWTLYF